MQNFGATFGVPGIITIGPNFKVIAVRPRFVPFCKESMYPASYSLARSAHVLLEYRNSEAKLLFIRKFLLRELHSTVSLLPLAKADLPYSDSEAHVDLQIAEWDITQRYPNPNNDIESGKIDDGSKDKHVGGAPSQNLQPQFYADVSAKGDLTASM